VVRTLLDADTLPDMWYCRYGMTQDRAQSLTRESTDPNSFLNPLSETALTLFMLGKLDNWFQASANMPIRPRVNSRWNREFFQVFKKEESQPNSQAQEHQPKRSAEEYQGKWPAKERPLANWAASLSRCAPAKATDAILLFEFEVYNSALAAEEGELCPVSFLAVSQAWCKFDAVIILPKAKHLIFVESKLTSDMSRDTTYFPLVSQAIRGWESAFLLTRCKQSVFWRWTYNNVLLCPREQFKCRGAYYAYVYSDPEGHVARFRDVLSYKYGTNRKRIHLSSLLEEFQHAVGKAVKVVHWDELARRLELSTGRISRYLARLPDGGGLDDNSARKAAAKRFRHAGIDTKRRHICANR